MARRSAQTSIFSGSETMAARMNIYNRSWLLASSREHERMSELSETRLKPSQADAIVGEFVTEKFDYDDKRQVTVHETLRLHEYSPKFDPERFAAHERFFVEDVGAWTRSRFGIMLPPERTGVFGVSAGGELALALGLRYPELYGAIFSASPGGGYRPPDAMPTRLPRTYLVAGTLEPFFLDNAARWAAALRDATADVVMSQRAAGHDDEMWRREFPLMIRWAFGRRGLR